MGVSYKSKSASVSYEPGRTSVRKLLEHVRGTVKYGATLETPVVTRLDDGAGTWTAFAEPPSCVPGSKANLVLRFAPTVGDDAGGFCAEVSVDGRPWISTGPAHRAPVSRDWEANASLCIPDQVTTDELLVRVLITRRSSGQRTTSLVVVVPLAPRR